MNFDCMQSNSSVYVISWHFIKVISFVWSNSLVAFTIGIMMCFKGKHFWGRNFLSLVALYRMMLNSFTKDRPFNLSHLFNSFFLIGTKNWPSERIFAATVNISGPLSNVSVEMQKILDIWNKINTDSEKKPQLKMNKRIYMYKLKRDSWRGPCNFPIYN